MNRKGFYRGYGKRALDLAIAVPALAFSAPLLAGVAILVAQKHGRPILFSQMRSGESGLPFKLAKFRSMRNPPPGEDPLTTDAIRLTPFGRWLRSTSLDELPSLLNVIKGDMSIVGPRPLLLRYNDRYSQEQHRRMDVKPGMTGWAQVNGRNALTWDEKHKLDVWYVDNLSFTLDMQILFRTVGKVLGRDGIEAEGHATMPEFMGSAVNG